jgi:A/G-specific adenine glycosylase
MSLKKLPLRRIIVPMQPENPSIPSLTPYRIREFRKMIHAWYRENGRSFPWRETSDTYAVLISEIMLQQTQTDRVIGKYSEFLERFPDISALARAELRDILGSWQGLGYNRRAIALKKCAETIADVYGGNLPRSVEALQRLPGIGPYTARAVAAFAFNMPVVFIETNIRAVFIHHFFSDRERIKDNELLPLVADTLDTDSPRSWYNALMDYGVMLKRSHKNPGRRSSHHVIQAPFPGSNRELRSRILKAILGKPSLTEETLTVLMGGDAEKVRINLVQMEKEGFITRRRGCYSIS